MSIEEQQELSALNVWLQTFPQTDSFTRGKENANANTVDVLGDSNAASCVFDVAMEICNLGDTDSTMAYSGDLWDSIMSMTRVATSKRKSLEPPASDTPHLWDDFVKHAALANLLHAAVSHKDLQLRTNYVERIMGLPSATQRSLMSLIERRKKKTFGSSAKKARSAKKRTKMSATVPLQQKSPYNIHETVSGTNGSQASFTPRDTNATMTPNSAISTKPTTPSSQTSDSGRKPPRGVSLFSTPKTPRRNFDQAFGATPLLPNSAHPSPKRVPVGSKADASFLFSPGLGDTAEYEKEVQALREKNEELAQSLDKHQQKENETTQKLEDLESNFRKDMIKIEAEARRREDQTKDECGRRLRDLQSELENVGKQREIAEHAKEELAGVKDEMELMVHTKSMLAETNERLRNYKEKLQQLTDVKEALQREEAAHSNSVEECLRLENEMKTLQPLKRQLEEYKTRAVDAEVRFTDCQDELDKLKHQRLASSDTNSHLAITLHSQQDEIDELRSRVHHEDISTKQSAGVGEGLSELNPELKEEVYRLRNENMLLKEFAAKREDDAVTKMEQEVEDATRLSERYKTQFLTTKGQLETTQGQLRDSRDREAKLRNDLAESMEKNKTTQGQAEKVAQDLVTCLDDLNASLGRESQLENDVSTWMATAKNFREQAHSLSGRVQKSTNDLEASQTREINLRQEIEVCQAELVAAQNHGMDLSTQLQVIVEELKLSQQREVELKNHVTDWTKLASKSQAQVKELSENLNKASLELSAMRTSEDNLKGALADTSNRAMAAEERVLSLTQQLDKSEEELAQTTSDLSKARKQVEDFENDLADMTSRAEDSEIVSKQRMELVQSTREKLKSTRAEVEALEKTEESLNEDIQTWTDRAEVAEIEVKSLEKELKATTSNLESTREQLTELQANAASLETRVKIQAMDIGEWSKKTQTSESLTERLQEELVQTREILNVTQISLKDSHENEALMKEGFGHAERMMTELKNTIEQETNARSEVEAELKKAHSITAKLRKDFEAAQVKLASRIEEETNLSNKYKQDLFHAQESLNETQGSLGASQHREKMLKHETTKLQDRQAELEQEIEKARKKTDEAIQDSEKSLVATREVLNSKLQKDMEEMQLNMNQLLEDERWAKRQAAEQYQQHIRKLREGFETEMLEFKKKGTRHLAASTKEAQGSIERMKAEYERQLDELRKHADEDNDKLVAKGKGMLKDVRTKAKGELDFLKAEFSESERRLNQEKKEKEKLVLKCTVKISEYKKKLQFTTSRISSLSADSNDLEERTNTLEREKFKLQEENDRYRRQLGGRFGPDSKLQGQLDVLQKEFKAAMDETRELRSKLKSQHASISVGVLPSISEGSDADHSYSRDAVNQSTLVQLRTEYEETIEALNDEKRELVMRNSAAITDVQKVERRAWDSEQENGGLKQEVTSLKLQVERLEHLLTSVDAEPLDRTNTGVSISASQASQDENENKYGMAVASQIMSVPTSGVLSTNQDHSNGATPGKTSDETAVGSTIPHKGTPLTAAQQAIPSFLEVHGNSPGKDAPPECQQS